MLGIGWGFFPGRGNSPPRHVGRDVRNRASRIRLIRCVKMPVSTMFGAASAGKTLSRCRAYALAIFATTAPVLFVCYAGTMRPPLAPLYCRGALSVTPPAVEGGSAEVAARSPRPAKQAP